jgi:streptogramin lyase
MSRVKLDAVLAAVLVLPATAAAQGVADPAAAERQYRVAQRLGADGSQDAPAAFERVLAMAPNGPLADDALVDLARFFGAPDWPEELGGLDPASAARVRGPLEKVVAEHAGGDRAQEARYRLALVRLAPIPGRDAAAARRDLISLSAVPSTERWVVAARYVLGWLDERSGVPDRASGAFARILVESPESTVSPRASAGFGRTMLAAGRFGEAAGWFQEAIDGGADPGTPVIAMRDLAVREVLRERLPARRWAAVASPLPRIATPRGASALATGADGRLVVFDRKRGVLQSFDPDGNGAPPVPVTDVTAMATDEYGRVFVATKDSLLRWSAEHLTVVSSLGDWGSPSAIAVDAAGVVWIADRKGDRIARWDAGVAAPVLVRDVKGSGFCALAVTGGRVVVADTKSGRIIALGGSGSELPFGTATFRRPVALAVDAAGRVSVLDEKAGTVTRLTPSGEVIDTLALAACGVSHPLALSAAPDGAVRILDGSTGAVAVAP